MRKWVGVVWLLVACQKQDPRYCETSDDCQGTAFPICDVTGAMANGPGHTCVESTSTAPDGMTSTPHPDVISLYAKRDSTCARLSDGTQRCWGADLVGTLDAKTFGDDEPAFMAPFLPYAGKFVRAENVSCLLSNKTLRCWGNSTTGLLGDGIGQPKELLGMQIEDIPPLDFGEDVLDIDSGSTFFCAVLSGGLVRCWGRNEIGQLGIGNVLVMGDNEAVGQIGNAQLGAGALSVKTGDLHACALLTDDRVLCWGKGANLGSAVSEGNIGDDEFPHDFEFDRKVPGQQGSLDANNVSCAGAAAPSSKEVSCWGPQNNLGTWINTNPAGIITVAEHPEEVCSGETHACARFASGGIQCWGSGDVGLGYGNKKDITSSSELAEAGLVPFTAKAKQLVCGNTHTCALFNTGEVYCWGVNFTGALGYGDPQMVVGNDEIPQSVGPVPILAP